MYKKMLEKKKICYTRWQEQTRDLVPIIAIKNINANQAYSFK